MSSPVDVGFQSLIKIDRKKTDAVYMQIVYQFINAVRRNLLEDGDRLPGSRKIAAELQVHRKTMIAALDELQDQGWVQARPNVGTFVRNPEGLSDASTSVKAFQQPPQHAPFDFRKEVILDNPLPENLEGLYFTDGTPDYRIIAVEELVRFYASVLKRKKRTNVLPSTADGNLFFREQLSYYLNLSRGFHLSRNFLLPISGREQVFSIISRLLISSGDIVLVENLSYFSSNMIFSQAGARLKTVPVDKDGMDTHYIQEHFNPGDIRLVYINPQSQYPTTVRLSESRKTHLLELAQRYDFIVIEDDADFEFSATKNKSESLLRKNAGNRVLYLGTFGGFLNSGFQMNFIIGPKDFLEEGKKYLNIFGKPNFMMEQALGEIIHQGDILRYQRKFRRVSNERKALFAQLLHDYFQDHITFTVPDSGLAFWIRFEKYFSLTRLQEKTKEMGLVIPGICLYQNRELNALRLGFAHLNRQDMEEAVRIFDKAYREVYAY